MEMVRHETKRENFNWVSTLSFGKEFQERFVILTLMEDFCPAVASIDHMVSISSHLSAGDSRHGGLLPHLAELRQEKVACPLFRSLQAEEMEEAFSHVKEKHAGKD